MSDAGGPSTQSSSVLELEEVPDSDEESESEILDASVLRQRDRLQEFTLDSPVCGGKMAGEDRKTAGQARARKTPGLEIGWRASGQAKDRKTSGPETARRALDKARGQRHTGPEKFRRSPTKARKRASPEKDRRLWSYTDLKLYDVDSSSESSDDERESSRGRRRTETPRVRSEIHIPPRQRKGRSRVRFGDASEDRYYTCSSDQEMDGTDTANRHGGRSGTATNGRERVSDQGGESHESRESGDRKCCSLVSRIKKKRRGFREGGEDSSDSEDDEWPRRPHRPSSTHRRHGRGNPENKSARRLHRSRRGVTPQSSSDEDGSVSRREERRKREPFSGHLKRNLANVKLGRYDGSTCLATFLAKFENCSQYYSWTEKDCIFSFVPA